MENLAASTTSIITIKPAAIITKSELKICTLWFSITNKNKLHLNYGIIILLELIINN
ncbi:MAG: hypothetical protein ACEY3J_02995 [Arsenophonus sp.]